jgi:predicted DNA-binding helix-hairpin-helix protein
VELPSGNSLEKLAPQKRPEGIFTPMRQITQTQAEQRTLKSAGLMGKLRPTGLNVSIGDGSLFDISERERSGMPEAAIFAPGTLPSVTKTGRRYRERFAPAGQTTQMIIGASPESDRQIIGISESLYRKFSLKRVYFSAYIPVSSHPDLPDLLTPPPLKREHRLYQADWLLRFYGFTADEILSADNPNLDYELDPKIVWALRHIEFFPIEVNKASQEELLRIPGVGNTSAIRIMRQRKVSAVRYDDLKKMGVVLKRARFFLTCSGKYYGDSIFEPTYIRDKIKDKSTLLDSTQIKDKGTLLDSTQIKNKSTLLDSARIKDKSTLLDSAQIRSKLTEDGRNRQISMFEASSHELSVR